MFGEVNRGGRPPGTKYQRKKLANEKHEEAVKNALDDVGHQDTNGRKTTYYTAAQRQAIPENTCLKDLPRLSVVNCLRLSREVTMVMLSCHVRRRRTSKSIGSEQQQPNDAQTTLGSGLKLRNDFVAL
ncbi:hypothetical protein VKT23_012264 [Stygiomarasmius scandens]|uniref:Uncharacterized protein n=1 Tax=Marasmiellus scandens TaxID=2682957 RepID=A0ABR1J6F0_9AGAR